MKVILLGDTHMPRMAKQLPPRLTEELRDADRILHTGDWQTADVAEELQNYAPVEGVAGNVDPPELLERFGKKKTITIDGIRIGLVHGDGKGKNTPQRALDAFRPDLPNFIVFGHSHIPLIEERNGVLLFNPGSPTDKRRQPRFSFGVLETADADPIPRHIFFDSEA
ncbi:metallophosphoesterase family protein [Bhargavaea ullalensis]|uniref:Phosphoesterase n=1 Tax=Bhargavaea ullalensis TaxID=1265685 RepID=A0ABV2GCH6_9BACL